MVKVELVVKAALNGSDGRSGGKVTLVMMVVMERLLGMRRYYGRDTRCATKSFHMEMFTSIMSPPQSPQTTNTTRSIMV